MYKTFFFSPFYGLGFLFAQLFIQEEFTIEILLWMQCILASIAGRKSVIPSCAYLGFPVILLCRFSCLLLLCILVTSGSPCEPAFHLASLICDSMNALGCFTCYLVLDPHSHNSKIINIYLAQMWLYQGLVSSNWIVILLSYHCHFEQDNACVCILLAVDNWVLSLVVCVVIHLLVFDHFCFCHVWLLIHLNHYCFQCQSQHHHWCLFQWWFLAIIWSEFCTITLVSEFDNFKLIKTALRLSKFVVMVRIFILFD